MSFWLFRPGSNDQFLDVMREFGLLALSFNGTPDLRTVANPSELRSIVEELYPQHSASTVSRFTTEISNFMWAMKAGDAVIVPYNSGRKFLLGRVSAKPYEFIEDLPIRAKHVRGVEWYEEFSRERVPPELWKSLRARMTILPLNNDYLGLLRSGGPFQLDSNENSGIESTSNEGVARYMELKLLQRDPRILKVFWQHHLENEGGIGRCAACDFTHSDRGMFDIHHTTPISQGQRETTLSDLLLLCPRCHRTAHHGRGPCPLSLEELRVVVAKA